MAISSRTRYRALGQTEAVCENGITELPGCSDKEGSSKSLARLRLLCSKFQKEASKETIVNRCDTASCTVNVDNIAKPLHHSGELMKNPDISWSRLHAILSTFHRGSGVRTTSHEHNQTGPEENLDRNGIIHLQRRPGIGDLRAASELHAEKSMMIRLHKKARVEDLRALAEAHSPVAQMEPVVEVKTLDIMVRGLDMIAPITPTPRSPGGDVRHCGTCSCGVQAYIQACDVCKEPLLPNGAPWISWNATGDFCSKCIAKAFKEIVAEEDECEKADSAIAVEEDDCNKAD